jgi:hypothetical protein
LRKALSDLLWAAPGKAQNDAIANAALLIDRHNLIDREVTG